MKTLLAIMSYAKANATVARHFPWWLRSECDMIGVGHIDTECVWPEHPRFIGSIRCQKDSYAVGDNHILRFIDVLRHFLHSPDLKGYGAICVIEYDGIFLKPFPRIRPGEIIMKLAGNRDGDFRGSKYWHTPWAMDRIMAGKILTWGKAMHAAGLIEHGFIDRWLGLMFDLHGVDVTDTGCATYTQNTIDNQEKILECRRAVENGAWYVHGIKSAEVLQAITLGIA